MGIPLTPGALQDGVQQQHLDYYLDEFTFRFNRRRSSARGLLFHRLAQKSVAVAPAPPTAQLFMEHRRNRGEGDTHFCLMRQNQKTHHVLLASATAPVAPWGGAVGLAEAASFDTLATSR